MAEAEPRQRVRDSLQSRSTELDAEGRHADAGLMRLAVMTIDGRLQDA